MSTTARLALPHPALTDGPDGADVPYWLQALAEALDGVAPIGLGNLSARPVSTSGSPGIAGRFYVSRDQPGPLVQIDLGTSWLTIFPISTAIADGSITTAMLAAGAVTSAKIADGTIATADIAAKAITAALIADALKPSVSAGAGTEALRAIGASAGQVLGGNDARLAIISNGSTGTTGTAAVLADSPTLTGTPHVPTAAIDTNTDQAASTAFVLGQGSQVADGTPTMAGAAARGTSAHYARANHVHPNDTTKADLASPTFTGTVTAAALTATGIVQMTAAAPNFRMFENDQALDEGMWALRASSGAFLLETRHDDGTVGTTLMSVNGRVGAGINPTNIDFINLRLRNKGMNVQRHPFSTTDRHIESGTTTQINTGATVSVTFTDPFASTPTVVPGGDAHALLPGITAVSTTGATFGVGSAQSGATAVYWIAEGAD